MFKLFDINQNEYSKRYYKEIESILYSVFNYGKKRCKLYSCNAEIWEDTGILVLVSYGTPIAVYTDDGSLYDCLRVVYDYTDTSSQHIAKFRKWLAENNYPVNYAVRFTN